MTPEFLGEIPVEIKSKPADQPLIPRNDRSRERSPPAAIPCQTRRVVTGLQAAEEGTVKLRRVMSESGIRGRRFWLGHRYFWFCQALGWGSGILLGIWAEWVKSEGDVAEVLRKLPPSLINTFFALVITQIYRWLILAYGWKEKDFPALAPRVIAASLVGGFSFMAISMWTDPEGWQEAEVKSGMLAGIWISTMFVGWFVFYFGIYYYLQSRETRMKTLRLELSMKEAALASLRAQMNPHFLFNGLNALRDLIEHDPAAARQMVTRLARLFRASLATEGRRTIPLEEELEAVEAYLHVEKVRFEERLEIRVGIPEETRMAMVPPFLLQTLVENAVKYGVGAGAGNGYVSYEAMICDEVLVLTVRNPGTLGRSTNSTGMGLRMTRERLALLYGGRADFDIATRGNEVVVQVMIPQNPVME